MTRILSDHTSFFDLFFRTIDPLIVILTGLFIFYFVPSLQFYTLLKELTLYSIGLMVLIFPVCRCHGARLIYNIFLELLVVTLAWLVILIFSNIIIMLLAKENLRAQLWPYGLFQTRAFWIWGCSCWSAMLITRLIAGISLRYFWYIDRDSRTAVILGGGEIGRKLLQKLGKSRWLVSEVKGFFDDDTQKIGQTSGGIRVLGNLDCVVDYVKKNNIGKVFIALPMRYETRIQEIIRELNDTTADVFLVVDIFNFHILRLSLMEIGGLPLVNLHSLPLSLYRNRLLKWMEDKILASIILILISPLMILIAIIIKLTSSGPVLFKQRRYGINGEPFVLYKFRTMTVCEDGARVVQAKKNDPRVTFFGSFLRKTSLDELPQFINVLQGRMSIVGPRPHAVAHNEMYRKLIQSYMLRHKVKPGITGWAQVNGLRGEIDTMEKLQKRVEYDLYYISNWSLWFDLRIILLSIVKGFVSENAY